MENEINKEDAIALANEIYKILQDPKIKDIHPQTRYQMLLKKYPQFSQVYPAVMRYMAIDLKYSEKAFRRFLNKLEKDFQNDYRDGMSKFIEHQADYAKFLYLELCKEQHKHWNLSHANKIWQAEYDYMKKIVERIKKEEEDAKNQFSEEKKRHLRERREELINFINDNI
ncbi:MAG: hypothetical protein QW303_00530 [Nitrososphaerota archaeon]